MLEVELTMNRDSLDSLRQGWYGLASYGQARPRQGHPRDRLLSLEDDAAVHAGVRPRQPVLRRLQATALTPEVPADPRRADRRPSRGLGGPGCGRDGDRRDPDRHRGIRLCVRPYGP